MYQTLTLCEGAGAARLWFCMASFVLLGFHNSLNTNPKWSGTSDSILTFQQFAWIISWFCMASLPQLLVLFGFHNSLNTNPKRSGTSDSILTFQQFAWIISCFCFVWLLSRSAWFCVASATRLIQI